MQHNSPTSVKTQKYYLFGALDSVICDSGDDENPEFDSSNPVVNLPLHSLSLATGATLDVSMQFISDVKLDLRLNLSTAKMFDIFFPTSGLLSAKSTSPWFLFTSVSLRLLN